MSKFENKNIELGLIIFVCFGVAVVLQHLAGALFSEFGATSDEAAHFVTSLMVRDYLLYGEFQNPLWFAEDYYLHYPKVAIGHWPPVFYGAMGFWFLPFEPTRASALVFIALTAALTAGLIYLVGRDRIGRPLAALAAVLFILLPVVQQSTGTVMLEHMVTLFSVAAVVCFGAFVRSGSWVHGLAFSAFAVIAILTRGSAWALGLVPLLTIIFAGRFDLLRSIRLWVLALPVLVFCVPWYVAMPGINVDAFAGEGLVSLAFTARALPTFLTDLYLTSGLVLSLLAGFGVWATLIQPKRSDPGARIDPMWAALAAFALATLTFHSVIAAETSNRYLVPILAVVPLFVGAGIVFVSPMLRKRTESAYTMPAVVAIALLAFAVEPFRIPQLGNSGYAASLEPSVTPAPRDQYRPTTVLIASGTTGEGSIVAAAAKKRSQVSMLVLRGSKILVDEDWMGRNSKMRFGSAAELDKLFAGLPVDVVILDKSVPEHEVRPYHGILADYLRGHADWQLQAKLPIETRTEDIGEALVVYRRPPAQELSALSRPLDIELINSLNGR